jgi:hypothetical protein
MKQFFRSIALVCAVISSISAQETGIAEVKQLRGKVVHFIYTSMPEGVENPVTVLTGTVMTELTLSKRMASEPVKIPADGIVRLVRKLETPPAAGQLPYKIIAQTTIAENIQKALVVLMPVKANPEGLLFQCKTIDLASFKGGDYLYINLTTLNVAVDMGTTKIPLKPADMKIYNAPTVTEPINVPIRYSYYDAAKEEWNVISSSTVALYGTRREICIFSWDPRFNRIDYHGITFPVAN